QIEVMVGRIDHDGAGRIARRERHGPAQEGRIDDAGRDRRNGKPLAAGRAISAPIRVAIAAIGPVSVARGGRLAVGLLVAGLLVAGLLVAWLLVARRTVLVLVGWGGPPGVAEEQEAVLSRSAAGDERQADGQCATVPHECRSRSCAARWLRLPRCRPAAA